MKLVKPDQQPGEFDIYLGPATVNGKPIGKWYQSRTAEEYARDEKLAKEMKAAWDAMGLDKKPQQWRVPIFKDGDKYEWRKVVVHRLGKQHKAWRKCKKSST